MSCFDSLRAKPYVNRNLDEYSGSWYRVCGVGFRNVFC